MFRLLLGLFLQIRKWKLRKAKLFEGQAARNGRVEVQTQFPTNLYVTISWHIFITASGLHQYAILKHIRYYVLAFHWSFDFIQQAAAKSLQSCPTLCDPIDGSPPGSPVPGILQARTLEWVAISFSKAWKEKWKWSRSVMSDSVPPHTQQPTRLLRPWDFPGKSTGVGCHCLLPYAARSKSITK